MGGPLAVTVHEDAVTFEETRNALYTTRRIHPRVTLTWE